MFFCFDSDKRKGREIEVISPSQALQIAGRSGRFGTTHEAKGSTYIYFFIRSVKSVRVELGIITHLSCSSLQYCYQLAVAIPNI